MYLISSLVVLLAISFHGSADDFGDFFDNCRGLHYRSQSSGCLISANMIRAKDSSGKTCLLIATEAGNCEMVERLVQHTACEENATIPQTGETALMLSAKLTDDRCYRALMLYRPPILAKRLDGSTVLHQAIYSNHPEIVRNLSSIKKLLDIKTNHGRTALMLAIMLGRSLLANELITKGANINLQDISGRTPLHYAAARGEQNLILRLLHRGAQVNSGITSNLSTPLSLAVKSNMTESALLLMNRNAIVNAVDRTTGKSVISLAIENRNAEIVRALINNGANVLWKGPVERNPLYLAARNGLCEAMQILAGRTSPKDFRAMGGALLIAAIKSNQTQCVKTLLQRKVKVNQIQHPKGGEAPLHQAVRMRNTEMVSELLLAGADAALVDRKQRTPLSLALQYCHLNISLLLLKKYSNATHTKKPNSATISKLLAMAANCNFPEVSKLLILKSTNISAIDSQGMQPLHQACANNKTEAALALIESGADINYEMSREDPKTPLYICSKIGANDVVQALLRRGAKLRQDAKANPLLIAVAYNRTETAMLLMGHGAKTNRHWVDLSEFPYDRDTPLHIAARNGNRVLVKRLIDLGSRLHEKNAKEQTPFEVANKNVVDLLKDAEKMLSNKKT